MLGRFTLSLISVFLLVPVFAQDNLDELMGGFEDEKSTPPSATSDMDQLMEGFNVDSKGETSVGNTSRSSIDWLSIGGYSSLSTSINYQHEAPQAGETDFRGLSRLRFKVLPELKIDLPKKWDLFASVNGFYDAAYLINDRDQYQQGYLDEYESEIELRELWLSGSPLKSLDIKVGRQIVAWGKSDTIRVVDVLNPLDMREPGMVDLEDLRLPVTMLRTDYFLGPWAFSVVLIPEIHSNKMPVPGSDFYPVPFNLPPEKRPENWKDLEFGLSLSGIFSGWDASFHLASTYEDQAHLEGSGAPSGRAYSRINLFGAAGNAVAGSWLIKSEVALSDGYQFFGTADETFTRSDIMLGADYSGITDHTFSLEMQWTHIFSYDDVLKNLPDDRDENSGQTAFRYTGTFMREKLQIVGLVSLFGLNEKDGGVYRVSAKYIPMDAMSTTIGVIAYQGGSAQFLDAVARNDRLFAELRYDF